MALISAKKAPEKEKIKIEISKEIYSEIKEYCSWVGIDDISYFFEESSIMIFSKDKEWKQHRKEKKQAIESV
ncbi:TPA: hypothetical protein JBE10_15975 [Legionella pneumophila subsp. pneumophila]|uniref:hypothetical protein n=1 Tax=Legionella TaxID=445 RepID=UPI000770A6A0|nr:MULTISPECIES: hypothetical protein [Legionella]HAT9058436.1 hypothetical protein [Legionella pneumophila subsp. pneumophila]MCW8399382.1 hypothetical protein [Legionella sp. PATHC038]CZG72522.1 Uncharacterised protein [Legionella pneumophila]CZG76495.1 Uncharacterised protein [Legionella pneumophila]CZG94826.1 Uncharacterised protein [Legionella pneumophila]